LVGSNDARHSLHEGLGDESSLRAAVGDNISCKGPKTYYGMEGIKKEKEQEEMCPTIINLSQLFSYVSPAVNSVTRHPREKIKSKYCRKLTQADSE
jgi:hypothetical protein